MQIRRLPGFLCLLALSELACRGTVEGVNTEPGDLRVRRPPNLVVIMADDLDVHTTETLLSLGYLPNIKRFFVDRGLRFRQSFVTNSLCCPSRSTFLSGQYTHNHGVEHNYPPEGGVEAFHDELTIATMLQRAGYRTGFVGKYLNGYGSDWRAPRNEPVNPHYRPPNWDSWDGLVDPSTYDVYNYTLNHQGETKDFGDSPLEYQTTVLESRAVNFIRNVRAEVSHPPMFLWVTPLAPHVEISSMKRAAIDGAQYQDMFYWYIRPDPMDALQKPVAFRYLLQDLPFLPGSKPSFNEKDVSDKPGPLQRPVMVDADIEALRFQYRSRFASMLAVDDLVGSVANALGPELDQTVLVFTSDNGFLYGEHRMAEKLVAYEESIRVPLFIAAPSLGGPTGDTDAIALNNDLAPTLAELGGTFMPRADGTSLAPLLRGERTASRKRFLIEHHTTEDAVFDVPDYTAVRTSVDDSLPLRTYVEYHGEGMVKRWGSFLYRELYDLTLPGGVHQLQSLHADLGRARELSVLGATTQALSQCGKAGQPSCHALEFQ